MPVPAETRAPSVAIAALREDAHVDAMAMRDVADASDSDAADVVIDDVTYASTPGEPWVLTLGESEEHSERCNIRVGHGRPLSSCTSGTLSCIEAARGRISRLAEDDGVWICEGPNAETYVLLTAGAEVIWDTNAMGYERTCSDYTVKVVLAPVSTTGLNAVLVQARMCSEPAEYRDRDHLWLWQNEGMTEVASSEYMCGYGGATDGPTASVRGDYQCQGSYVTTPNREAFNTVGYGSEVRQRDFGAERLMLGRGYVQTRNTWRHVLVPPADSDEAEPESVDGGPTVPDAGP